MFSPFGSLIEARIVRDAGTGASRGFGFLEFGDRSAAETALASMNGQPCGSRSLRLSWALGRRSYESDGRLSSATHPGFHPPNFFHVHHVVTFAEALALSSPTNTTVYVGGLAPGTLPEHIKNVFRNYGMITDVRVNEDKGFAFVTFTTHESAAIAISMLTGTLVNGRAIRCSWGREAPSAAKDEEHAASAGAGVECAAHGMASTASSASAGRVFSVTDTEEPDPGTRPYEEVHGDRGGGIALSPLAESMPSTADSSNTLSRFMDRGAIQDSCPLSETSGSQTSDETVVRQGYVEALPVTHSGYIPLRARMYLPQDAPRMMMYAGPGSVMHGTGGIFGATSQPWFTGADAFPFQPPGHAYALPPSSSGL
jgi:RNA recognition motif-containing protein